MDKLADILKTEFGCVVFGGLLAHIQQLEKEGKLTKKQIKQLRKDEKVYAKESIKHNIIMIKKNNIVEIIRKEK
jgi:demethoxyubiquinone hydroxylase (CLK1/Coq7/Cat5 family)